MSKRADQPRAALGLRGNGTLIQKKSDQLCRCRYRQAQPSHLRAGPGTFQADLPCHVPVGRRVAPHKFKKRPACHRCDPALGYSLSGHIVPASGKRGRKPQRFSRTGNPEDHSPARGRIQGQLHLSGQQKEDVVRQLLLNKQSDSGWVGGIGSKRFEFAALIRRQSLSEVARSGCAGNAAPTRSRAVSHQSPPPSFDVFRDHSICSVRTSFSKWTGGLLFSSHGGSTACVAARLANSSPMICR